VAVTMSYRRNPGGNSPAFTSLLEEQWRVVATELVFRAFEEIRGKTVIPRHDDVGGVIEAESFKGCRSRPAPYLRSDFGSEVVPLIPGSGYELRPWLFLRAIGSLDRRR